MTAWAVPVIIPFMKEPQARQLKSSHTDICLWLDYYGDFLSERQLQIMTYFFADDLSLAEIADLTGLTRQGVHEQVRRGAARLEAFELRLRLAERDREMSKRLQDARESLQHGESEKTMRALDALEGLLGLRGDERN